MGSKKRSLISRREFARRAAFVSAAASLSPADLLTSKILCHGEAACANAPRAKALPGKPN
jgi:hypothetical protein